MIVTIVRYRRQGWIYLLVLALFGLYLLAVIDTLFFPVLVPENWPANLTWKDTLRGLTQTNLIPFYYGPIHSNSFGLGPVLYDIVGNCLLTIPFGLGFCFLTPFRDKRIFWVALGVGLFTEGTQLLIKLILGVYFHSVDINDVILNSLGVIIGFGLYLAGAKIAHSVKKPEYRSASLP